MKRLFLSLIIALLWVPATTVAEPALWKVQSEKAVLYVFGTMHRLPEETDWFDARMKLLLLDSDSLVIEVKTSQASQDFLGLIRGKAGVGIGRVPLRQEIRYSTYEKIKAQLETFGIDENALNSFRPWLAAILLGQLGGDKAGYLPEFGADNVLEIFAFRNAVPREGLETAGEQYMLLAQLPKKAQVNLLEQTLENVSDPESYYQSLYDAWSSGDIKTTEKLVLGPLKENRHMYTRLVLNRNKSWAEELGDLLEAGGQHFVAVGTGHLIGSDSVLKFLEKKGYTVSRVQ